MKIHSKIITLALGVGLFASLSNMNYDARQARERAAQGIERALASSFEQLPGGSGSPKDPNGYFLENAAAANGLDILWYVEKIGEHVTQTVTVGTFDDETGTFDATYGMLTAERTDNHFFEEGRIFDILKHRRDIVPGQVKKDLVTPFTAVGGMQPVYGAIAHEWFAQQDLESRTLQLGQDGKL